MRITQSDLEAVVLRINRITDSPESTYTKDAKGKFHANMGNYHLDWAYGGVCLCRICNKGGGVEVIISGYCTKRELYEKMQAFIMGYCTGFGKEKK